MKNQKNQQGPYIEYGTVMSVDANGVGRIGSVTIGDTVIFSVKGASRAVVKSGRPRFESLLGLGGHAPKVGLEVAFIAGYGAPGDTTAIAEVWCSKASWEKAVAEARSLPLAPIVTPQKPHSHGGERVERGATGRAVRQVSKVVPFPVGSEAAQIGVVMDTALAAQA